MTIDSSDFIIDVIHPGKDIFDETEERFAGAGRAVIKKIVFIKMSEERRQLENAVHIPHKVPATFLSRVARARGASGTSSVTRRAHTRHKVPAGSGVPQSRGARTRRQRHLISHQARTHSAQGGRNPALSLRKASQDQCWYSSG